MLPGHCEVTKTVRGNLVSLGFPLCLSSADRAGQSWQLEVMEMVVALEELGGEGAQGGR